MCRCFSPSRQISAVHFGVQLGLNLIFRKGRLLRNSVNSDRASCCRRKRRELHPLRAIYSAPTTRRNQNSSSNTAEIRNSEKAGSLESGSRFERARLPRPRLAPGTATRPRRKTTQFGTNDRVGRTWRGATCCAASSGVYSCARRICREKHVPIVQPTLSFPEPECSKSMGDQS